MKFTSVLSAGLLLTSVASACLGSTTQGYDPIAQTYTISTSVTSQFYSPNNPFCCEETGSFQGTFTIQFSGLNGISDPAQGSGLILTIPVIQTTTTNYPQLAHATVCLTTWSDCYSPPSGGTQTLDASFMVYDLSNTLVFSWPFGLTTNVNAQSHQPGNDPTFWLNTTATGTEVVDFADLTLIDRFGNNVLSQGVTFQVTEDVPEPSSWALAGAGLALFALGARRVLSR